MRAATGPSGGVARISAAVMSAAPATAAAAAAAADISIVAGSGLSGDRRSRLWFW